MNRQIQKGLVEPYGYRSLANAVGARLLVEVPSWTGVVWRPGMHSFATRAMAGASKLPVAAKWIAFLALAATLEEALPDDEHANSERLG